MNKCAIWALLAAFAMFGVSACKDASFFSTEEPSLSSEETSGDTTSVSYSFDFQPAGTSGYTADGFSAVTVDMTTRAYTEYSADTGYGFSAVSGTMNARNRGTTLSSDYEKLDFVTSSATYTFKADVANGNYTIVAYVGDTTGARTTVITVGDTVTTSLATLTFSSSAGEVQSRTADVTVTGGTLEFVVTDSNSSYTLNAITITSK